MLPRNQICLLIGTPRGFTRSVLEALLKRGSRVILACPDPVLTFIEHKRLSELYGPSQLSVNVIEGCDTRKLESVLIRALDSHGDIDTIINSTSDSKLNITRGELQGNVEDVELYINRKQIEHEVQSIKTISKLAVKYMGRQSGFQGGNLLNLVTRTELTARNFTQNQESDTVNVEGSANRLVMSGAVQLPTEAVSSCCAASNSTGCGDVGCCTVLGTTRALGVDKQVSRHGVRTMTVYQPNIDYPDLSPAAQITDDQHSPYYTWSRYSAYCREYSGYMALHLADTATSGSAWKFNSELRLEPVTPSELPNSCQLTNKMCYWLGCPHVEKSAQVDHNSLIRTEEDDSEVEIQTECGWLEEDN